MEHGRLGLSVLRRTVVLSGWMAQKLKRMGAANLVENQYVVLVSSRAAVTAPSSSRAADLKVCATENGEQCPVVYHIVCSGRPS